MATTEQPASTDTPNPSGGPPADIGDFGANEWLVEDMYEQFLADPDSVDGAWHDLLNTMALPTLLLLVARFVPSVMAARSGRKR